MTENKLRVVKTRRYDKKRGCYVYDIAFKARVPHTERTIEVAEAFGLGIDEEQTHTLYEDFQLRLTEGDVLYITGDSGSGKSVLLNALRQDLGDEAALIDEAEPPDPSKSIIDTIGGSFQEALTLLSRVGLNDAYLFLRRYGELSDGQRYRYKIARMIDQGKKFWLADEFCSTLDRETARIVAYNIQKMTRRTGATLIVATTHTDLAEDLSPSVTIRKGWGKEIKVDYTVNAEPTHCTITDKITIRESDKDEYHKLGHLHYRSPKVPVPLKYYAMLVGDELAGVIAYSYPITRSRGRKEAVGYAPEIKELNKSWALISRVIIHPKYRTIGLGAALVRETLPMVGRTHVELIAVMARYNPFAEKAGMKLILLTEPPPDLVRLVEELRNMGFNPALIGSRSYNRRILDTMNQEEREALINIIHSIGYRYARRLSRKDYYPRKAQFAEWLQQQDDVSLAYTIQTIGTLAQCKAYLYWRRPGE